MKIKKVLLLVAFTLFVSNTLSAQRGQKIGYVDLAYILENIPEYQQAQNQLNQKAELWQKKLDMLKGEIETMKIDLSNEKALLTDDLIEERLEDIAIVEDELKRTEMAYFSADGDLFFYRKILVKPIQDQVYSAVQEIGKARGYDIIFDKSADLIMLYNNNKLDISDLVLKSIVRAEKTNERNAKAQERNEANEASTTQVRELTEEEQKELDDREAKRQEALEKSEQAKADRLKKREAQKAEIERKRQERLKQREEVRNQLKENKEADNKVEEDEDDNNNN